MHDEPVQACTFHADGVAVTTCQRCQRPICVQHAITAPVGYQCTDCLTPKRRTQKHPAPITRLVTVGLVALFALTQLADPTGIANVFGLRPLSVAPRGPALLTLVFGTEAPAAWPTVIGQPWLLLTSALLHANVLHIGFNAVLLWQLGTALEPRLGSRRFAVLLTTGALGGALGVLFLAWAGTAFNLTQTGLGQLLGMNPVSVTVGASGAVFALMGATLTVMKTHGFDPWRSGIGGLVVVNVIITFAVPQISVGGHIGGLLTGLAVGKLLVLTTVAVRVLWLLAAAMMTFGVYLAHATVAVFLAG